MQKVMLIGDSIRLSYQERVRQLLEGRAEVTGPADNCRFSAYTLFNLAAWLGDATYDVIQWNNGQWDTCFMPDGRIHTPLGVYLGLQKRIVKILRRKAGRLVFATTTPVHHDQYEKAVTNGRKNKDIQVYNRAAAETLSECGVVINDLYAATAPDILKHISDDRVHLTPVGVEVCARLVSQAVG
ncbi:MAG: hypothetical protein A2498_15120 [Lentisphaerae bacterium RIFOXYC12_FULL_60_16]|nr:MAG: hypothetical protein A2498_15120 [Lentisphaerae bacterium RIFOXYC12_FULL_60_16]